MNKRIFAVVILLVIVVGGACGNRANQSVEPAQNASKPATQERDVAGGAVQLSRGGDTSSGRLFSDSSERTQALGIGGPVTSSVPKLGLKIIKDANLEIKVGKGEFERRFTAAHNLAESFGGFVADSNITHQKDELTSGSLTIRVPGDRFQQVVTALKKLGKVTNESQSSQDVTSQVVDLEARLRHAKAQEVVFLRLMEQSKSISDIIAVQQQLSNVQLEIEQFQGQLNAITDLVSMATIRVSLFEPGAKTPGTPRGIAKALREALDGAVNVVGGIIVAAGWLAPIAVVAIVIWLIVRRRKGRADSAGTESG